MKTKPIPFYFLLLSFFAAVSCSKPAVVQPAPEPVPVVGALSKVDYGGGEYDSLYYNSDLQLIKIKSHTNLLNPFDQVYTFEYDAGKKITRIVDHTGEHYEYKYVNGVLTGVLHFIGTQKVDYRIYDYKDGKLATIEEYYQEDFNTPGYLLTAESELAYYADGNLKSSTTYSYDQARVKYKHFSTTYTDYDTKLNPAGILNRFTYFSQIPLQKNNPGRMISKDEVSGAQVVYDFTYTYNDFSNPLTQKMVYGNGQSITSQLYYY